MTSRSLLLLCAVAFISSVAIVRAHEITYKGAVVSVAADSVSVSVVDAKTKKTSVMKFDVDKDTKILRGDAVVTFKDAKIQKGEQIAVTINHDADETLAVVVRLTKR